MTSIKFSNKFQQVYQKPKCLPKLIENKSGPDSGVEPESPPLKGGALPLNLACETTQGLPLS